MRTRMKGSKNLKILRMFYMEAPMGAAGVPVNKHISVMKPHSAALRS